MKAGICFTGTGPILFLTTYSSFADPELLKKFDSKGIKKFIAYEVPLETVQEKYGAHYGIIMGDLKQESDLRVLDYDGHHVFYLFSLRDLGEPIIHDESAS
ncbi:MAG: hypothetical protein KKB51_23165 [Candidatus Riflebacteria bacterium]|nr:hypothetical protein [Candidatus Riflebacteria bacterium]